MERFGLRYASLLGITMTLFVTFVACGSQLYQVSLKNDSGARPTAATNATGLMATGPTDNTNPSSPNYAIHAPDGWNSMPIHYKLDYTMTPNQIALIQKAMHTWELATGRTLFVYEGLQQKVNGDSFPDLYSSLDDAINGLYLDANWAKTGKEHVVLATTIWDNDSSDINRMATADMHYNTQDYVFGDSMLISPQGAREVVDLQTVATHELGHFLGLNHVDPSVDPQSIMVASLYIGQGVTQRTVSAGDITRMQKIYGCAGTSCDVVKTQLAIANLVREPAPTQLAAGTSSASTGTASVTLGANNAGGN